MGADVPISNSGKRPKPMKRVHRSLGVSTQSSRGNRARCLRFRWHEAPPIPTLANSDSGRLIVRRKRFLSNLAPKLMLLEPYVTCFKSEMASEAIFVGFRCVSSGFVFYLGLRDNKSASSEE
jgi:hypothetical protein